MVQVDVISSPKGNAMQMKQASTAPPIPYDKMLSKTCLHPFTYLCHQNCKAKNLWRNM